MCPVGQQYGCGWQLGMMGGVFGVIFLYIVGYIYRGCQRPKGGKFQARVTHKPSGISQRHLGLFDTVEEAEAAISGAVEDLIAGSDPASLVPLKTPPPPVSSIQSLRAMARSAAAACGQIVSSPSALSTRIVAMVPSLCLYSLLLCGFGDAMGAPRLIRGAARNILQNQLPVPCDESPGGTRENAHSGYDFQSSSRRLRLS